jgi:hypothetical protein
MRGRDDEVETWGNGEAGRRGGAGALTRDETRVPMSLLQREKDRKRGWGGGEVWWCWGGGVARGMGGGLVVGGADESMRGRDDGVET